MGNLDIESNEGTKDFEFIPESDFDSQELIDIASDKELVLVVDDQPENLKLISSVLSKSYQLSFANNGLKALQILESLKPDLILLDVMMPVMDGYEVCKMIKSNQRLMDIPVIFLSARSDIDDILKGFELGAVDYITKPFNVKEVRVRIGNHLKLARAKKIISHQKLELEKHINDLEEVKEELEKRNEDLILAHSAIEEHAFLTNNLNQKLMQSEYELKHTNRELTKTNFEKDKFFSILAHDLRSPFSGFLGLTRLMSNNILDISVVEMQEMSQQMQKSASNLYRLLENLLEWSRFKRGFVEYHPQNCILNFLVKENIDIANVQAKLKEIELINKLQSDVKIYVDESLLNTIIRNLISNAIKFTPRGGTIEIGVLTTSGDNNINDNYSFHNEVETCYVRDSGIGMNEDIIKKLFRIDEKSSRPGTEDEPSTGLGLILCKEFIEKNQGSIWVESKVGEGCTFFFTVPKQNNSEAI